MKLTILPLKIKTFDTIVISGSVESFDKHFLQEGRWYPLRLDDKKIPLINWVAIYQKSPICAITHYAKVISIEKYQDYGRYQINIYDPVVLSTPLRRSEASKFKIQGTRYTTIEKVRSLPYLESLFV